MERKRRVRAIWGLAGAVLAVAAIVVPLLVLAGSGQATLTAETYADVIRFGVQGAGTLQIQIYDLAEKELWDSGAISSDFVDWDRTDTWGERLANGYYLYLAQAWDMSGSLILSKTGKVALLPGDQVQLQQAPIVSNSGSTTGGAVPPYQPMGLSDAGVFATVGIGTSSPTSLLQVVKNQNGITNADISNSTDGTTGVASMTLTGVPGSQFRVANAAPSFTAIPEFAGTGYFDANASVLNGFIISAASPGGKIRFYTAGRAPGNMRMIITPSGQVGIGTANTAAQLTVQAASGNLIAAYNSSSRTPGAAVFVVTSNGDVKADGSFYGASLIVGSADVAERINASEWVEAGDVVEIDPDHAGFFRKSTDPYSRRVAGIISTSPGVILGNSTDSETDDWDDSRPVLAIAGRVPTSVTTENGPIAVGDLLVASSTPGVAMRGDPSVSVGAVVGKAMEPLSEGVGSIMAQVMLR